MATSGSTDFSYNRDQIIRRAGRLVGAFSSGEIPDANTVQDFSDALNAMVKAWEGMGIHVWTETEAILFLQPGQTKYTLGGTNTDNATADAYVTTSLNAASPLNDTTLTVNSITGISNGDNVGVVLDNGNIFWTTVSGAPSGSTVTLTAGVTSAASSGNAIYTYTTKIVRPLRIPFARRYNFASAQDIEIGKMSRRDYLNQPNKTSTGTVNQFFYDAQLAAGYLNLWQAPASVEDAVKFTWYRPIQDFDTAGDTPDLPQEWISTLVFNLAVEMAPEYGLPGPDFLTIRTMAKEKLDNMEGWDREDESVYFSPAFDPHGG